MGSGCNSNCNDIFGKSTPDTRVDYTGSPSPSLGICTHDKLNEVLQVVIQKITDYATGVGISLPDIDLTTCDAFADCVQCCGSCTDLPCLLNCYKNAICSIFNDVAELKDEINTLLNGPYDTGCLDNVTSASTLNQIIQEMILELCALETALDTLEGTVSGFTAGINTTIGNFLNGALTSCQGTQVLNKTGSGATLNFSLRGFCPIGTIMPYGGDVSKFDSSGLGFSNTDCCGWALCNGNNGTFNMSGLIPVGTGMGPAVITGLVIPFNTTGGEYAHTLVGSEIPSTSVSVSGSHTHDITAVSDAKSTSNVSNNIWVIDCTTTAPGTVGPDASTPPYNIPHTFSGKISTYSGTFTGSTGGGGGAHNNMPPYRALYYIQRVS